MVHSLSSINEQTIVVIDDHPDYQEFIRVALEVNGISDNLVFFHKGTDAFNFLERDDVVLFMKFSHINVPGMNGFELPDLIHENPVCG